MSTLCGPCWTRRAEEARFADDVPLPVLTGTEPRRAWAEDIRKSVLGHLIDRISAANADKVKKERKIIHLTRAYTALRDVASSKTWIDSRHLPPEIFGAQVTAKALEKAYEKAESKARKAKAPKPPVIADARPGGTA